ncbi:hypothetical protein [Duganella sp. Leaf126]|uniref:hypothetical protein n=1 Tax=Duganella sp. Leaf126 TaxID=1736266 RepID=UPI0012E1AFD3|nr:hypothetical protein [Duganella sp. Leaf126]
MDFYEIAKIAAAVTSFVGGLVLIWRANKEIFFGSRNSLREEYKFAKTFFEDLDATPDMHPHARQKGFHAIAGTTSIPYKEIEFLLTFKNHESVLSDYVIARDLLIYTPGNSKYQIDFRPMYAKPSRRDRLQKLYLIGFGLSYAIAVLPLLGWTWKQLSIQFVFALAPVSVAFLFGTYHCAKASIKLKRAERLVSAQQFNPMPTDPKFSKFNLLS